MAARPDPFPSGILPVGMTARQPDSASEELADSISIPTLVRASYTEQRYVVVLA